MSKSLLIGLRGKRPINLFFIPAEVDGLKVKNILNEIMKKKSLNMLLTLYFVFSLPFYFLI